MFKKLKITCDQATTICDKGQYGESTFFEKIQLNIHFLACNLCAAYTRQNVRMSKIFKMKAADCKDQSHCLSSIDKEFFKKELEEALSKK
jgi:hypothetical protein